MCSQSKPFRLNLAPTSNAKISLPKKGLRHEPGPTMSAKSRTMSGTTAGNSTSITKISSNKGLKHHRRVTQGGQAHAMLHHVRQVAEKNRHRRRQLDEHRQDLVQQGTRHAPSCPPSGGGKPAPSPATRRATPRSRFPKGLRHEPGPTMSAKSRTTSGTTAGNSTSIAKISSNKELRHAPRSNIFAK